MRVRIKDEEKWPVYYMEETYVDDRFGVEVSTSLSNRYEAALKEWEEVQAILERIEEGGTE